MKLVVTLFRRAIKLELALYRSLARWIFRRPDVPSETVPFTYVGAVSALLWVIIAGSAIELLALHMFLPWPRIRDAADVLSIWGLVWMFGLMASFRVYPHLLGGSGLRIRRGAGIDIAVPWDIIETIAVRENTVDKSRSVQVERGESGSIVSVVLASRTNVDVVLRRPLLVPLPKGEEPVAELRLYVDEPRALTSQVRKRLAAQRQAPD